MDEVTSGVVNVVLLVWLVDVLEVEVEDVVEVDVWLVDFGVLVGPVVVVVVGVLVVDVGEEVVVGWAVVLLVVDVVGVEVSELDELPVPRF